MRKEIIYDYYYTNNIDDYFNSCKGYSKEELKELFDVENIDDLTEEEKYNYYNTYVDDNFDFAKSDLNMILDNDIIAFGDIGTWRGTFFGYKELNDNNLNAILNNFDCDYFSVYSDGFNVRFVGSHHDGSHNLLLRKWKKGISDEQKEKFLYYIYNNHKITKSMISYYTSSLLPFVSRIYGIKCNKKVYNSIYKNI